MNQKPLPKAGAVAAALAIALLVRCSNEKSAQNIRADSIATQAPAVAAPPLASIDSRSPPAPMQPGASATSPAARDSARNHGAAEPAPPAPAQGPGGPAASALKQAAVAYAGIRSLRADFVQRSDNPLL